MFIQFREANTGLKGSLRDGGSWGHVFEDKKRLASKGCIRSLVEFYWNLYSLLLNHHSLCDVTMGFGFSIVIQLKCIHCVFYLKWKHQKFSNSRHWLVPIAIT